MYGKNSSFRYTEKVLCYIFLSTVNRLSLRLLHIINQHSHSAFFLCFQVILLSGTLGKILEIIRLEPE